MDSTESTLGQTEQGPPRVGREVQHVLALDPTVIPLPPQEMCAHLDTLKRLTEAEGRDFSALTISYKAPLYDTGIPDRDGTRRSFSGTAHDIAGDIRSFAAIGVHELIFDFRSESIAESIDSPSGAVAWMGTVFSSAAAASPTSTISPTAVPRKPPSTPCSKRTLLTSPRSALPVEKRLPPARYSSQLAQPCRQK